MHPEFTAFLQHETKIGCIVIKRANYLDHEVGAIFIEGQQDKSGKGYFRACVEIESSSEVICSTSKKGLFIAVKNLCKRLDKHFKTSLLTMPEKWQIYLSNPTTSDRFPVITGYLSVRSDPEKQLFWADLFTSTFNTFNTKMSDEEKLQQDEEDIRNGFVNSVEDAFGQSELGALANLCQKAHSKGLSHTIDSLVLDSLAASFFLPTAIKYNE